MPRPARKRPVSKVLLTEVELELMNLLWELGEGTVNDVLEKLSPTRVLAYTSVATILRILEQKGVVASEKVGRGHVYRPLIPRQVYKVRAVKDVVGRVFGGDGLGLVRALIDSGVLTDEQQRTLEASLTRAERDKP
jgi:predicted transcriptional regulator